MILDRRTLLLGSLGLLTACATSTGDSASVNSDATASDATASDASASTGATATPSTSDSCGATTQASAGENDTGYNTVREDITEDRDGIPLELYIAVVRTTACTAIADATVSIWHCDASGTYSDGDSTFLRGTGTTDTTGTAHFTSIYPGWEAGQAPRIYARVNNNHYQLFLPKAITTKVATISPYSANTAAAPANAAVTLEVSALKGTTKVTDGYLGVVILRVDA